MQGPSDTSNSSGRIKLDTCLLQFCCFFLDILSNNTQNGKSVFIFGDKGL